MCCVCWILFCCMVFVCVVMFVCIVVCGSVFWCLYGVSLLLLVLCLFDYLNHRVVFSVVLFS